MFAKLNDSNILSMTLTMPRIGAWTARVESDSDLALSGQVVITVSNGSATLATLSGTVVVGDSIHGRFSCSIVGGSGKLSTVVPAKAFATAPFLLPLQHVADSCGEALDPSLSGSDACLTTSPRWFVRQSKASSALTELALAMGATWRVTTDGKVWIGTGTYPAIKASVSVMEDHPSDPSQVIACDDALILPGVSVAGRSVASVIHTLAQNTFRTTVFYVH